MKLSRALALCCLLLGTTHAGGARANEPPVLDPISSFTVQPGESRDILLHATDPENQPLFFYLDFGPFFLSVETTSPTTGILHVAPSLTDAGTFTVVVRVAEEFLENEVSDFFVLTVDPGDGSPIAYPGGPYLSDRSVQFDGTASFDPEGGPLTYLWDFGDGVQAVGPAPLHEYLSLAGIHFVSLTVTDIEGKTGRGETHVLIGGPSTLSVFARPHETIRLRSNGRSCVHLESDGNNLLERLTPGSVRMRWGTSEARATDKNYVVGDADRDNDPDMRICFEMEDLRRMFSDLPPGTHTVRVQVLAEISTFPHSGYGDIQVQAGGAGPMVAPNPARDRATLIFQSSAGERVTVRLYDVSGRLVRTLVEAAELPEGPHALDIPLVGPGGRSLGGGIYFYEIRGRTVRLGRFLIAR